MTGTEKQIKWAEDIKFNAYSKINAEIEFYENQKSKAANETAFCKEIAMWNMAKDLLDTAFSALGDSAATIIDKRDRINTIVNMLLDCRQIQLCQGTDAAYDKMEKLCGIKK